MFEDRIRSEFLRSLDGIRFGWLRLTTPDGATRVFAGDQPGPDAALTILDRRMVPALAAKGDIGLTEAYRDGWCDTPDLTALLTLGLMNEDAIGIVTAPLPDVSKLTSAPERSPERERRPGWAASPVVVAHALNGRSNTAT